MNDETTPKTYFRKLRKYKYQLTRDYSVPIQIQGCGFDTPYLKLTPDGELTIKARYAWDGPSGPTIDTRTFMRGALVHDGLYQLIREGRIGPEQRKYADILLRRICREDGMSAVRALYVYWFVRWFGCSAAKSDKDKYTKIRTAP